MSKNIFGEPTKLCSHDPLTGFYRDGHCKTGQDDMGTHTVCAIVSRDFLDFTKSRGNDLETPRPEFDFQGLRPGDRWCLCALRWKEAFQAGKAPLIDLEATNEKTLEIIPMETLLKYAWKKES